MIKLKFTNAVVKDDGYGVEVNGEKLEEIISNALGTRAGKHYGYNADDTKLKDFSSNSCNVTIIFDPSPRTVSIQNGEESWDSVEQMVEDRVKAYEYKEETTEGDPEE